MAKMSKTMKTFFDELHKAEFGYGYGEEQPVYPTPEPKAMVKLLKRALTWKTYDNLYLVVEYLGAEDDERNDTVQGCKEIINEDLEYWKKQV